MLVLGLGFLEVKMELKRLPLNKSYQEWASSAKYISSVVQSENPFAINLTCVFIYFAIQVIVREGTLGATVLNHLNYKLFANLSCLGM